MAKEGKGYEEILQYFYEGAQLKDGGEIFLKLDKAHRFLAKIKSEVMKMKKNEEPFQMKGKGMAAAIAICFIAVVALVGAYTFSSYKREMKEQLAKAEEEQKEKEREAEEKEQSEAANTDRIVLPEQEEAAQNSDGEEQQEEGEATEHAKETPAAAGCRGRADGRLREQQLISVRKTPFCGR